jgi:ABC-2 type transport system permease protein
VLGNAFGGKIRDAKLGFVDEDGDTHPIKVRQAFDSVRATCADLRYLSPYDDERKAMQDVRNGKIEGAVIIPPQYSKARL